MVCGEECSALIEAGHPRDLQILERQLDGLLLSGLPELRYVFLTHHETPHSAGVGRILQRFPAALAVGGVMDLHLAFPDYAERFHFLDPGQSIDLGGTSLQVVESVVRDHLYTRWAFDTRRRVLFPGDGFAYAHYHEVGQCGAMAEEATTLEIPDMTALFADLALYWTRFVDLEPYIERLDELVRELEVRAIAPTHGLPIGDPAAILPRIRDGLRLGGARMDGAQIV